MYTEHRVLIPIRSLLYTQRDQSRKELGPETRRINWPILIALMKEQINQHCFIWGYTMQRPISIRDHTRTMHPGCIYTYIYMRVYIYIYRISLICPVYRPFDQLNESTLFYYWFRRNDWRNEKVMPLSALLIGMLNEWLKIDKNES